MLPLLTRQLLDHLEHEGIEECEIYWQGGEAMIMGPAWFAEAGRLMDAAAAARGRRFKHYLQTNLISYSPAWNEVLRTMFGGSLGTSMDYPNLHRKLFAGGAEAYTRTWTERLHEAVAAGIEVGVIAVLHRGSLEVGPERFYRYFTEDLGLKSFQVNTPFPGGPAKAVEADFDLDKAALAQFLAGLFDIWMERGHASGRRPRAVRRAHSSFHRRARAAALHLEGELFQPIHLRGFQRHGRAVRLLGHQLPGVLLRQYLPRRQPDARCCAPVPRASSSLSGPNTSSNTRTVSQCRYLSICHGGCPVRTYSALGTMLAKDPYCEVYKAVFGRAETHSREILRRQVTAWKH